MDDALAAAGVIGGAGGDTGGVAARGVGAGTAEGEPELGPGVANGDTGGVPGRAPDPGTNGGADGPPGPGARGGTNAGVGGEPNSGIPPVGDGGVAVAVTGPDSSRLRGGAGISAVRVGGAGGGAAAGGGVYGRGGAGLNGCDACADGAAAAGVTDRAEPEVGVVVPLGAGMGMTPLQTEHRARTPFGGTLAGSTRKIERQSGQLTFIHSLRSCEHRVLPAEVPAESRVRRFVYRQYKLSRAGSWRMFSFRSQVDSPGAPRSTYDANW